MNMVRWLGRKRVLSSLVIAALSVVGILFALTPQRIAVHPDKRWESDIQNALTAAIQDKPLRTLGAMRLRDSLTEDYPCLKDITISYSSSLEAHVKLHSWKPRVTLCSSEPGNKVYVVCEKGRVLEKRYFKVRALQGLPAIEIKGTEFEELRQAPELVEMALTLRSDILDMYRITWYSKSKIKLKDKELPITIIADHASVNDAERYECLHRIFNKPLEQCTRVERQYKKGMKADIRLKDSLVCAPHRKL